MRIPILLLFTCTQVQAYDPLLVDGILDNKFTASHDARLVCNQSVQKLKEHTAKIGGKLWYMETHDNTGYDIRYRDRVNINVRIEQQTEHIRAVMESAAYKGDSSTCDVKLAEGIQLANDIFYANIKYRKINVNK